MECVDEAQEGGLWSSPQAYKTPSYSQVDGIDGTVQKVGVRNAPLTYVVRAVAIMPAVPPPL